MLEQLEGALKKVGSVGWLANLWSQEGISAESRDGEPGELELSHSACVTLGVEAKPGLVGFAAAPLGAGSFDAAGLVARALASASSMEAQKALILPEHLDGPPDANLDIDAPGQSIPTPEEALELAACLESAARQAGEHVSAVRRPTCEASRTWRAISLNGELHCWAERDYCLHVEVAARSGAGAECGWEAGHARHLPSLDPEALGKAAAERAIELLGARQAPTGRYDVLFDWRVAAQLLGELSHSLLGESHLKKTTFLLDKLGERVFSELVTIVDDGVLPGGPDTQPLDGEGGLRRRTQCITGGVLECLLYDRASGTRAGQPSTGNCCEGTDAPSVPGVTNLLLMPGDNAPAKLLEELRPGLWVRDVLGMHTTDPVSGDFSVGCSGLWVEDGVVSYPVAGATLSGNIQEIFSRVAAVGDDFNFSGAIGAPSFLSQGMELAGGG